MIIIHINNNVLHFSFTISFVPNLSQNRPTYFSAPPITIAYVPRIRGTANSQDTDHVSYTATPAKKQGEPKEAHNPTKINLHAHTRISRPKRSINPLQAS